MEHFPQTNLNMKKLLAIILLTIGLSAEAQLQQITWHLVMTNNPTLANTNKITINSTTMLARPIPVTVPANQLLIGSFLSNSAQNLYTNLILYPFSAAPGFGPFQCYHGMA